ncbi:MAG: tetraacyldisaccharide 4'-kinase [Pseudomonadota bacterium]
MKAPDFWYPARPRFSLQRTLLAPAAALYEAGATRKLRKATPYKPGVPVICIGNATVGGVGKTPAAAAIARLLTKAGEPPHILMRGYGGRLNGPVQVNLDKHRAKDVGDEALLLAREAPVWIARDRAKGAKAATKSGARVILMDDGFQNPSVEKTFSLLLIDSELGFGNGAIFPAGPLRERPEAAIARADAVVFVKRDLPTPIRKDLFALGFGKMPRLQAWLEPQTAPEGRVVAFSGIGRPQKFFDMLGGLGLDVAATKSFPDHHPFTKKDIKSLHAAAKKHQARLITTDKDLVRLSQRDRQNIDTLPVAMAFDQTDRLSEMLCIAIERARHDKRIGP